MMKHIARLVALGTAVVGSSSIHHADPIGLEIWCDREGTGQIDASVESERSASQTVLSNGRYSGV
jgi:hypothetical protein